VCWLAKQNVVNKVDFHLKNDQIAREVTLLTPRIHGFATTGEAMGEMSNLK
jgi:hypothetical protein